MNDLTLIPTMDLIKEVQSRCITAYGAFQLPDESPDGRAVYVLSGEVGQTMMLSVLLGGLLSKTVADAITGGKMKWNEGGMG